MARIRSYNLQSLVLLFLAFSFLTSASVFKRQSAASSVAIPASSVAIPAPSVATPAPSVATAASSVATLASSLATVASSVATPALARPSAVVSGMNSMAGMVYCSSMPTMAAMPMRKRHGAGGDDDEEEMPAAAAPATPVAVPRPSNAVVSGAVASGRTGVAGAGSNCIPRPASTKKPSTMHGTAKLRRDGHIAHGVIMCLATCLFFPMGAILLRVIEGPKSVKVHYLWQTFGLLVMLIGFSLGVWIAWLHGEIYTQAHQTYGTVLVFFFLIQPIVGIAHHRYYKRHGRSGGLAKLHVWFGRFCIIMAVINGGLGMQASGNLDLGGYITYSIEIVLITVAYVGVVGGYYLKKHRTAQNPQISAPQPLRPAPADSPVEEHGGYGKEYPVGERRM